MTTHLPQTLNAAQTAWLKANKIKYHNDGFGTATFSRGNRSIEIDVDDENGNKILFLHDGFEQVCRTRGGGVKWYTEHATLAEALKALAAPPPY